MASSPFLSLPREVRDLIYAKSVPYAGLNDALSIRAQAGYNRQPFDLKTPNILLLNRQITAEALSAWRRQPFTLTVPVPRPRGFSPHMNYVREVLSQDTLQALTHVHLVVDVSVWKDMNLIAIAEWTGAWDGTVALLNKIWLERNKLEVVNIRVIGSVPAHPPFAGERQNLYNTLLLNLWQLWNELATALPDIETEYTFPEGDD